MKVSRMLLGMQKAAYIDCLATLCTTKILYSNCTKVGHWCYTMISGDPCRVGECYSQEGIIVPDAAKMACQELMEG